MYLKELYTDLYKVYFCLQSLQVLLFFLSHPFVFWCHWSPSFWWLTDLLKSDQAIWRMAHGEIEIDSLSNCFSKIAWVLLWSLHSVSHSLPNTQTEICMSDFTHCQLLYSPLSSSAFLNMHALHFLTTFQIQMDVPCSRLHSLLPPLTYCFCSLQLRFICGWPNFQVWSILWCRGRLWSSRLTDRQTQSTSASWHRCLCCAHPPFCKNEPITLRLLVPNPDPLLCLCGSRHKHATPSCSSTAPFTIWSEDRTAGSSFVSLTGCNGMHYTTTSQIPLFITYGQEQTWDIHHVSNSLEGDCGGRDWRSGLTAYPFVWVHHDLIHLHKVYLEIWNDCSISRDWIL